MRLPRPRMLHERLARAATRAPRGLVTFRELADLEEVPVRLEVLGVEVPLQSAGDFDPSPFVAA